MGVLLLLIKKKKKSEKNPQLSYLSLTIDFAYFKFYTIQGQEKPYM